MSLPLRTPPVLLDGDVEEIHRIGLARAPSEACGVLLPTPLRGRRVWEMPNRSSTPHDAFAMMAQDVLVELGGWIEDNEPLWGEMIYWHTHPAGNAAPSRADVEHRLGEIHNLLVALTDHGPAPCWF